MPKKWIKDKIFNQYRLHERPYLDKFGRFLLREELWHINRRSISQATAIGLFSAFIPIPFQMVLAGFLAIFIRANVLLSVALVWITNPLTIGPIFYICYQIGRLVLGEGMNGMDGDMMKDAMAQESFSLDFGMYLLPLFVGSFLVAGVASILGYFTVNLVWRLHIVRHLKQRRLR